jgi:hypothetical protein
LYVEGNAKVEVLGGFGDVLGEFCDGLVGRAFAWISLGPGRDVIDFGLDIGVIKEKLSGFVW